MRPCRSTVVSLAVLAGSILSVPATAAAASAASCSPTVSPALARQNASAKRLTNRLLRNTSYTPIVRTFTPKIARTQNFNGFGSVVLRAPKGTTPVVGSFVVRGAEPCAITITSASVVLRRNAYVMNLRFPGEQGSPGRITITLISR